MPRGRRGAGGRDSYDPQMVVVKEEQDVAYEAEPYESGITYDAFAYEHEQEMAEEEAGVAAGEYFPENVPQRNVVVKEEDELMDDVVVEEDLARQEGLIYGPDDTADQDLGEEADDCYVPEVLPEEVVEEVYHDTFSHHHPEVKQEVNNFMDEVFPENKADEAIIDKKAAPDNKGPLPDGWCWERTADGELYFANHESAITSWDDPRSKPILRGDLSRPADACRYFLEHGHCPLGATCSASHVTQDHVERTGLAVGSVVKETIQDVRDLPTYQTAMTRKQELVKSEANPLSGGWCDSGDEADAPIVVEGQGDADDPSSWRFGAKGDILCQGEEVAIAQNQITPEQYSTKQSAYLGTSGTVTADSDDKRLLVNITHADGEQFNWHKRDILVNRRGEANLPQQAKPKMHSWRKKMKKENKKQRGAITGRAAQGVHHSSVHDAPWPSMPQGRAAGRGRGAMGRGAR